MRQVTEKAKRKYDLPHDLERKEHASERTEGTAAVSHMIGGAVEQLGHHAPLLGVAGTALSIAGIYIDYYHAITRAYDLRVDTGKLQGWLWTMFAANELDLLGRLGEIDSGAFERAVAYQRDIGEKRAAGAHERAGTLPLGLGRNEGAEAATKVVQELLRTIAEKYSQMAAPPPPGAAYDWRLSEWKSRRAAYAKEGLFFNEPGKELRRIQHIALREFMSKVVPDLKKRLS